MRVLLVEDNAELSLMLTKALKSSGFAADSMGTAEEATEALSGTRYAAVILDLGLPDGDGLAVLQDLRRRKDSTPVIVLTARATVGDRVKGLRSGADDYLVKPFDFEELLARLRALLRRPRTILGNVLQLANVQLDTESRQVSVNGTNQTMSTREVDILELLIRRSGLVMSKKLLEDQIFGHLGGIQSNAIEVYVHRVRRQLASAGARVAIHTVRGVGYLLAERKQP
jgi:DNA-binding response OmpR family regulator